MDPELFYPEAGGAPRVADARRICVKCPVRTICLETAMAEEFGRSRTFRFGIRGGATPHARYELAKQRGETISQLEEAA